jgi:hypothetical protein
MTPEERIKATARRVGLDKPLEYALSEAGLAEERAEEKE